MPKRRSALCEIRRWGKGVSPTTIETPGCSGEVHRFALGQYECTCGISKVERPEAGGWRGAHKRSKERNAKRSNDQNAYGLDEEELEDETRWICEDEGVG